MFSEDALRRLLRRVQGGEIPVAEALDALRVLPFEHLEDATLDHHRELRTGCPEVIYCAGKTPEQVADIAERLACRSRRLLGTRATPEHFEAARRRVPELCYHASARCITRAADDPDTPKHSGITIICAGTGDLPVADEAAVTLDVLGHRPARINDVGVAGLHRLLHHLPALQTSRVVIAVAGMEGAMPSVIAGLISAPVIAVPTSVGYGANFGGLSALLGMLNSCAAGIATVNIDNGFGAAYMAAAINNQCLKMREHGDDAPAAVPLGHHAASFASGAADAPR